MENSQLRIWKFQNSYRFDCLLEGRRESEAWERESEKKADNHCKLSRKIFCMPFDIESLQRGPVYCRAVILLNFRVYFSRALNLRSLNSHEKVFDDEKRLRMKFYSCATLEKLENFNLFFFFFLWMIMENFSVIKHALSHIFTSNCRFVKAHIEFFFFWHQ